MQKIFRLLLVAAVILIGVVWFSHWSKTKAMNSGAVHVRNQPQGATAKSTAPESAAANPTAPAATADQSAAPQEVASTSPEGTQPSMMVPQHAGPITEEPAANALSPHPPSGFVTPATQKFALYRQGDLTYRLNTQSGQACILLATDALWQKPLVYQHGCGNH